MLCLIEIGQMRSTPISFLPFGPGQLLWLRRREWAQGTPAIGVESAAEATTARLPLRRTDQAGMVPKWKQRRLAEGKVCQERNLRDQRMARNGQLRNDGQ
jgi:hypothetical protein